MAKHWAWLSGDAVITDFTWVTENSELAELCSQHRGETLALDTEFTRRSTYYAQLALVQVRACDRRYLIDPLKLSDWAPLNALFSDSQTKLLHAPLEDFEVFRHELGCLPEPLVDTQLAAAFLGLGDSLSYAALVQLLTGVELAKSQTQSDWMQRPLSPAQIGYALDDVEWLQALWDQLRDQLDQQGKLAWFRQACDQVVCQMRQEPETELAWKRLKGLERMPPPQQARAAGLANWREAYARQKDKPRNWILRDAAIYELARQQPASQSDLARAGVEAPSLRRHGAAILQAAHAVWQDSPKLPPVHRLSNDQQKRVKALREQAEQVASTHKIAQRLIASRAELEQLVQWQDGLEGVARPDMSQDWRAAEIFPLLNGENP